MKKLLILMLAVIFVVSLTVFAAGCKEEAPAEETAEEVVEEEVAEEEPSAEPVTLRFRWWGGEERHDATLAAIELYKEKTGVTVEAEPVGWDGYESKMVTELGSGTAPDILQLDQPWLVNLVQTDVFVDLTNNPAIDWDQFDPDLLDKQCVREGQLIGLPTGGNTFRFMVNKGFMEENDIDLDKQYTWDEWFTIGEEINNANPDNYLMAWDPAEPWHFFEDYIRDKTGDFLMGDDYEIHASREDIVESLTMLEMMYNTGTSLPVGEVQPFPCIMYTCPKWLAGEIGGVPDFASKISTWEAGSPFPIWTIDVMVPTDAKQTGATYRPAQLYGVPKSSANQEEAIKFVNWMLTDKEAALVQGTARSVPAAESAFRALEEAGELPDIIVHAMERGIANQAPAAPAVFGDAEIVEILTDTFERVATKYGTIESIVDELISRLEMRLDEMKG